MITSLNFMPAAGCKPAHGYGKLEQALWSALVEQGVAIHPLGNLNPVGIRALSDAAFAGLRQPPPTAANTLITAVPDLGDDPISYDSRLWLYTMSESNRVGEAYVSTINTLFTGVMVTCPDLVPIYHDSGVTVPVHYVPMGITPPPVLPQRRPQDNRFIFLTYSLGEMRKGAELAIMAFKELFGGDPRYQLLVKAPADPMPWLRVISDDQVILIDGKLSEQAWFDLLASVDCFIFPSRGEGFGLPPREAALVGTPTIATEWLGMWDVACWGYPIEVSELRGYSHDDRANHRDALWAEPSMDSLKDWMRYVANNPDAARQKTERGRVYLQEFTWARTAKLMIEIMGGTHAHA